MCLFFFSFSFLTAIKASKLNIYTKTNCGLPTKLDIHRIIIWRQKIWGHLRTIFSISRYRYPDVGNIFVNISAKTKIFWDVDLGPRYYRFMKKNRSRKSHAGVRFTMFFPWNILWERRVLCAGQTNFVKVFCAKISRWNFSWKFNWKRKVSWKQNLSKTINFATFPKMSTFSNNFRYSQKWTWYFRGNPNHTLHVESVVPYVFDIAIN